MTKVISIDQLQALVKQLKRDNKSLLEDNGKLKKSTQEMQRQIDLLISKLNLSNSKRFGKQSEKAPRGTFNEAESTKSATQPKHHNKGKQNLPEYLEREEVEHKLEDTNCGCCGHQMHVCGSEESEQIKIIPAKISVIKHKQLKYACRECEHTQIKNKVVTASKPKQPIPRSIASPEALAAVVTAKYCDALPLYRQVEIFKRGGLDLSRGTLANWCVKSGAILKPLVKAMQQHLVTQHSLCADETCVQVLDEPDKSPASQSYMWVYRSNEVSKQPVVIYDYQPGRSRKSLTSFLQGFKGYLQCDGYRVYDNVEGMLPVGCWAHTRRKYDEALRAEKKSKGRAHKAISFISKLYKIENQLKAKDLSVAQRYQLRQEKARPILDAFKLWLDETNEKLINKSYIAIAVQYTLNQWEKLIRYIEDGELGIDNNITERDIRPFTTGRKNWMFCQSVKGAEASAVLYSIVMTCRANDINPYYYFLHLFKTLPNLDDKSDLTALMPWNVQLDYASALA